MRKKGNPSTDPARRHQFLKKPTYPGGNEAFRAFITENLRYPQEALDAGVEGFVVVEYDILDTGQVRNQRILKGLGHGCDEEALRVVGLLRFDKVKNRGVRLKVTTKTNINFALPGVKITYSAAETPKEEKKDGGGETYGYTISW